MTQNQIAYWANREKERANRRNEEISAQEARTRARNVDATEMANELKSREISVNQALKQSEIGLNAQKLNAQTKRWQAQSTAEMLGVGVKSIGEIGKLAAFIAAL